MYVTHTHVRHDLFRYHICARYVMKQTRCEMIHIYVTHIYARHDSSELSDMAHLHNGGDGQNMIYVYVRHIAEKQFICMGNNIHVYTRNVTKQNR